MTAWAILGVLSLSIWIYLVVFHGGFWRCRERIDGAFDDRPPHPEVVALVPARNEADVIAEAVESLLIQDYPGRFTVILIDDHSDDDTAEKAEATARRLGEEARLIVSMATDLPAGWTGKLWALEQGRRLAGELRPGAGLYWLTDADIGHDVDNLRRLVAALEEHRAALASQMVMLDTQSWWDKLLIPPFVYFFMKLYPFAWVNAAEKKTAGAAGGCILVRREALERIGGFSTVKESQIDDCALARKIKQNGGDLRLGLTTDAYSLRPYRRLSAIWRMVERSAFAQLGYSPVTLVATLVALFFTYLWPVIAVLAWPLHGDGAAALLGLAAWTLMGWTQAPILKLYDRPLWQAALLPLAGLLYSLMTLTSAIQHWRGRGGHWKGRVRGGVGA